MPTRRDAWSFWLVSSLVLFMISVPYLAAARAAGEDHVFAGLLQNPIDGNSYLAKMSQGWLGEWTFTLPYTAQPGEGTYLFLFYLFLGHLARLSGLSTVLVFHLARLASAVLMLLALWRFFGAVFPGKGAQGLAFAMACLGSGLGWLAALAGGFTADFWVAEAYPFLSAYANPHFPLGLALVLVLVTPAADPAKLRWDIRPAGYLLAGLALGIVMPFGVVVAAIVLAGALALGTDAWSINSLAYLQPEKSQQSYVARSPGWLAARIRQQPEIVQRLACVLAGGLPVLAYDYWAANTHPVLSGWNAQNLTLTPPVWDVFISFSPALWLALAGSWAAWRSGERGQKLLLAWAGLGLLLLYLPFGLQRRFVLGLFVPLAGLAALGIGWLAGRDHRRARLLTGAFFLLALPTNGMILLAAVQGIAAHAAPLYLERDEHLAMEWMEAHTPEGSVVLASPDTGLWIPAQTGLRVVAGHPFETVEAGKMAEQVAAIFQGTPGSESASLAASVDYVFIGPRERRLGGNLPEGSWHPVYRQGEVTIWAASP